MPPRPLPPVRTLSLLPIALAATPAIAQTVDPAGVDVLPMRTVFHDDVRVLWLGDSYALPYDGRVSGASLLSWRVDAWTAFAMGDGPNWYHVSYVPLAPNVAVVDGVNAYRLYETGPEPTAQFGLPLWRLREYRRADDAAGPQDVLEYFVRRGTQRFGFHGQFADQGDEVFVRQILLDPPGAPVSVPAATLTATNGISLGFDPRAESRPKRLAGLDPEADGPVPPADGQIFAAPFDLPVVPDAVGEFKFRLADAGGENASGYLFPAGFAAYQADAGVRRPGHYFSALTDGSWSYQGFGADLPSGTPGVTSKVYTREQLAHYLDATTLDPDQPLVAFYLVNVEDIDPATAAEQMEAMVDQTAAAAADAGLTAPVRHCIVIPWLHRIGGADLPHRFPEQRDAAFALAAARPDVSAVSIYDFTDAVSFDGNTASRQWLADRGYDNFVYGDLSADLSVNGGGANGGLLDVFRSHPGSRDAAAFFAHVIERVITDPCPADFAPPYGTLDLADINRFLTGFLDARPSADLAEPLGAFDLADLTAFITSFNTGCAE